MADRRGLSGQDCQDQSYQGRTTSTGQDKRARAGPKDRIESIGKDRQNWIGICGWAEKDRQKKFGRT